MYWSSDVCSSDLPQGAADQFVDVFGQAAGGEDALQFGLHQGGEVGAVAAPAAEGVDEAGGGHGVVAVHGQDLVGQEAVAGAAGVVEAGRVEVGEGGDQGAPAVGVLRLEGGVGGQADDVAGQLGRTSCREGVCKYV